MVVSVQTQQRVMTIVMIGAVGTVWAAVVGLFVLAITHDGSIATQVAQSATQIVGAAVAGFSAVAGVHVWTANKANPTPAPAGAAAPSAAQPPAQG